MSILTWLGSILAMLTYFPFWKQIRTGKVKQNIFSWVLWGALDAVASATIIVQKGNFLLPLVYAVGSLLTVFFLVKADNKARWTWFETLVATLVVASMVIWYLSGDKVATVASTMAMLISGIPQLVDAWKKPHEMPFLAYCSYFVANCLTTAGGANWSIKERFYPVAAAIFCGLIAALSARRNPEA